MTRGVQGRQSSLSPDPLPTTIALEGISSMDVATAGPGSNNPGDNACATTGGVGYCWGAVPSSVWTKFVRALPQSVVASEPLVRIATTHASEYDDNAGKAVVTPSRWCGVGASGAVYCWGLNANGQAGDGTKEHGLKAVPVSVFRDQHPK